VDPSEVEACSKRAKRAEKEANDAKSEVAKLKDLVNSMNWELKPLGADHKTLKG
jgi:hypothetical protein